MSNEKFTQGEWCVKDGHYPSMIDIHCGDCMSMCVVLSATDLTFEQGVERKANAHLISAAPDMYRALRDVADELPVQPNNHQGGYMITLTQAEVDAIRAALAKADGE